MNRVVLGRALALLLGLPGCDEPSPCVAFPSEMHSPAGMLLAGRPDEVTIFANVGFAGDCEGVANPVIDSVYAEIFDPDQQPVPNESSLVTPSTPAASIRFTPAKVGSYRFFVAFDPLSQIQQFDLLAVHDRSTEPPLQMLLSSCNALERTRSGTWICDANVFRGSVFVQSLPGARVAVAGDVVWVASGSQLLRYKDIGTELQLTATMVQQLGPAEHMLVSEDEAVLLLSNWIQRVTFDGTALSATSPTQWALLASGNRLGDEGPQGLLFRTGERLALLQNSSGLEGVRLQSCAYELLEGRYVRTTQPCESIEGFAVGFEPSVLWVADRTFPGPGLTTLQRMELTETGFVLTATLSVPPTLALAFPRQFNRSSALPVLAPNVRNDPALRAAVPVYHSEQSLLRLEHLDGEVAHQKASTSFFWGAVFQRNGTFSGVRIRSIAPAP